MKCEPVELSFDKDFSSTFSTLDQAFQRCCAEVTLNPYNGKILKALGGGGGEV